jgi:hypothetical protein
MCRNCAWIKEVIGLSLLKAEAGGSGTRMEM